MAENTIQWDKDADGIVTLTLDDPTGSANVMNEHYKESMHKAVRLARLVAEEGFDHRCGDHQRQEDLLRRRRPQEHDHRGPGERR